MFGWLKKLLYIEPPEATMPYLDVPVRYVNTDDTSLGGNFPGYFRFCMNLETGKLTKGHIGGTHATNELCRLDIKIAYDRLPDKHKKKYKQYLESLKYDVRFLD